jgi:transposase-like protein
MILSSKAQTRLAMLEFHTQIKDVSATCRMFKISRKNFYKWKQRYEQSGQEVSSLEDQARTPQHKRTTSLTWDEEMKIKHLRTTYIRLGKKKLQILYQKQYGAYMSCHHIQYVIEKHNLYYDPNQAQRVRTKKKSWGAKKVRVHEVNPHDYLTQEKPFYFATDTIVLYLPYSIKRYIVTAVEHERKLAYARVYKNKSSLQAFDFLMRLQLLVDGQISLILSDNGSEFAKYFDEACKKLKITHIYTRVKTPKDNAVDERFNRTIQEEFLQTDEYFEPALSGDSLKEANERLTEWLIFYNFERPHQTLKYQSPMEYHHCQLKVSPMLPSITSP